MGDHNIGGTSEPTNFSQIREEWERKASEASRQVGPSKGDSPSVANKIALTRSNTLDASQASLGPPPPRPPRKIQKRVENPSDEPIKSIIKNWKKPTPQQTQRSVMPTCSSSVMHEASVEAIAPIAQVTAPSTSSSSSSVIPTFVKHEAISCKNNQIIQAMGTWQEMLNPTSTRELGQPQGTPVLYLRIEPDGRMRFSCTARELLTGEKDRFFKRGSGTDSEGARYIYDPMRIVNELAKLPLDRETCIALKPFVDSVEHSLTGITGWFKQQTNRSSLQNLQKLKPEMYPATQMVGIRGTLYDGSLHGEKQNCNDWIGIKPNGTIGVIDGPGHGDEALPANFFDLYQEVFNEFDRLGNELETAFNNSYSRLPDLTLDDLERNAQDYLFKELRPIRQKLNQKTLEIQDEVGRKRSEFITNTLIPLKERMMRDPNFSKEDFDLLAGYLDRESLENAIPKCEANMQTYLNDAKKAVQDINAGVPNKFITLSGEISRYEEEHFSVELYRAFLEKDYGKVMELVNYALSISNQEEPGQINLSPESQNIIHSLSEENRNHINYDRLKRQVPNILSVAPEAMIPRSERGTGPAVSFAKVLNTKYGPLLLRLQAADATSFTTVPTTREQFSTLKKEDKSIPTSSSTEEVEIEDRTVQSDEMEYILQFKEGVGFSGRYIEDEREDARRLDTYTTLTRAIPGQKVAVLTDGLSDFLSQEQILKSVKAADGDPQKLYQQLISEIYQPSIPGSRITAATQGRMLGDRLVEEAVKPIDRSGQDAQNIDDFSYAEMTVVNDGWITEPAVAEKIQLLDRLKQLFSPDEGSKVIKFYDHLDTSVLHALLAMPGQYKDIIMAFRYLKLSGVSTYQEFDRMFDENPQIADQYGGKDMLLFLQNPRMIRRFINECKQSNQTASSSEEAVKEEVIRKKVRFEDETPNNPTVGSGPSSSSS